MFVVAHRYYGLSQRGGQFVSQQLTFDVQSLAPLRDDGRVPRDGVFDVRLLDKQNNDGTLIGLRFEARLVVRDEPVMTMTGGMIFVPSEDYEVMRAADGTVSIALGLHQYGRQIAEAKIDLTPLDGGVGGM